VLINANDDDNCGGEGQGDENMEAQGYLLEHGAPRSPLMALHNVRL